MEDFLGKFSGTRVVCHCLLLLLWSRHEKKIVTGTGYYAWTASHVNAAGFILDKAADQCNSVTQSTIDIKDWHNPTNQQ
jgi:hypothetical protein